MKNFLPSRKRRNGFTLIEVVIALGLMFALIVLSARLATANIQLANGISKQQSENSLRESFFEMMKMQLSSLPGNTRLELITTKGAPPYEYTLVLQNVPMAFTWGGVERIAKAVEIVGVKRRDGFINVVMRYYENTILSDAETIADARKEEPFAEILLMENLRFFEWRALNAQEMKWETEWDTQGRLPLQLELVTAQGANGDEMKQIFWIVPKVNPQTVIRESGQNQQPSGGQGGEQGGGQGGGTGGSININPSVPTGPSTGG